MSVPHFAPSGHLCSTPHSCWCTTRRKQTGKPPLLGLRTPRGQRAAGAPNRLAPLGAAQAHTVRLRYSTGKELYFTEDHSDLDSSPGP